MPCIGLKVLHQNLALPNIVLGRAVVMLPLPALVDGRDTVEVVPSLTLNCGGLVSGKLKLRVSMREDVNPDDATSRLKRSIQRVAGGLATRFKPGRLRKKLEVEVSQEARTRALVDAVSKDLDLEALFRKHGTGGGEGVWVGCVHRWRV